MGLLRLVLALSVIVAHVGPWCGLHFFGNGVMAVESFYILSGFYMALVLHERYQGQSRAFYFNRFLRLYPIYGMMIGIYLVVAFSYWATVGHPLGAMVYWMKSSSPLQWAAALFCNVTMLGCDVAELVSRLHPGDPAVNRLIIIQPTWSLSVEILFYAFVPFVVRQSRRNQLLLFLGAILIRLAILQLNGGQWTFWLYYFSPASWALFLTGVGCHHLLLALRGQSWFRRHARAIGTVGCVALCTLILFYQQLGWMDFQDWRYYALLAVWLPFVFEALGQNKWDARIAAWSYPLYLGHAVVLSLYAPLRHFVPEAAQVHLVIAASLALVLVTVRFDHRIQRRFKRRPLPPILPPVGTPVITP